MVFSYPDDDTSVKNVWDLSFLICMYILSLNSSITLCLDALDKTS